VTEKAQRTIHIKWVRSGIGFTRRQRQAIRGLGLRRLHHVVERVDTPQVRGLVAAVPHLVEIVKEPPRPGAWAAVPNYTIQPKPPAPAEESVAAVPTAEGVSVDTGSPVESEPATKAAEAEESPVKPVKAPKVPKAAVAKGKAAEESVKKKSKAADKQAKTSKGKK
jgi:large subunit ribosomal protein L30